MSDTAQHLTTALNQLGLTLYPWDGPHQANLNDPTDIQALADLLDHTNQTQHTNPHRDGQK